MKIIILGAGQVGRTVAEMMAIEDNEITVVDLQPTLLEELQHRLDDIRTVVGHASHPTVLYRAGIEDADLIFAVTNDDETNMIACQVAYSLFNTPLRLARVRSFDYFSRPGLFRPSDMPVDFVINPEQMVTRQLQRLIEYPGASEVYGVAVNHASLVGARVEAGSAMAGRSLADFSDWLGPGRSLVTAVYRGEGTVERDDEFRFTAGDDVFFFVGQPCLPKAVSAFSIAQPSNRRVVIAGGGNLGKRLAEFIELDYHVKIIERDPDRCRHLAGALKKAIVLNGDVTDPDFLIGEGIEETDVFCAVTNADKTNVVACLLAKKLGSLRTLSIVNNPTHAGVAQQSGVDVAVSPASVTIGAVLSHMRRGDIVNVFSLRYGAAEAIELIVHGERAHSPVVGRPVSELPLSDQVSVGVILRQGLLMFPDPDTVIEEDDQVVLFVTDKKRVETVEQLFQVESLFV